MRNPNNVGAARVIWNQVTANLVRAKVAVLILRIVGALAFAVAGPYACAGRARHKVGQLLAPQVKCRLAE